MATLLFIPRGLRRDLVKNDLAEVAKHNKGEEPIQNCKKRIESSPNIQRVAYEFCCTVRCIESQDVEAENTQSNLDKPK